MRKLMTFFLTSTLLFGCTTVKPSSTSTVQKEETTSFVQQYTDLDQQTTQLVQMEKENLQDFLNYGTGIIFFGFPECPWCQAYLPMLDTVLKETQAQAYYYNIYVDKSADRPFYDEVSQILKTNNISGNENVIHYTNEGKPVIYMPLTLFIEKGRIVAFEDESNTNDAKVVSPQDYWTAERKQAIHDRLTTYIQSNLSVQDQNNRQGCDNKQPGCKVG